MHKFKRNDVVRVVDNTSGHSFEINQLIRLLNPDYEDFFNWPYWIAIDLDGNKTHWIFEQDIEYEYMITIDPIDPPMYSLDDMKWAFESGIHEGRSREYYKNDKTKFIESTLEYYLKNRT